MRGSWKNGGLCQSFDHYHHKFQSFQLFCKIVKEFETEILIEI